MCQRLCIFRELVASANIYKIAQSTGQDGITVEGGLKVIIHRDLLLVGKSIITNARAETAGAHVTTFSKGMNPTAHFDESPPKIKTAFSALQLKTVSSSQLRLTSG
jgi:hypothetical protein